MKQEAQTRDQKRALIAMGRRYGASPQARARLIDYNSEQVWVGICQKCQKRVKGTPAQLKRHQCDGV